LNETLYVAYGLALRSSFALPGMAPADAQGLIPLALELASQEQLASVWSGADGRISWRGRLGDGSDLAIDSGSARDLLFSNGERASFHLDAHKRRLLCVPRRAGLDWQRTLVTKVLSAISVMCGYEALHASAVESPWGAIAIAAPSGMGKTTLALELMRRGWPLLSDDVVAMTNTRDGVLAFPGTPHLNVAHRLPDGIEPEQIGTTLSILGGERWIAAEAIAHTASPLNAVCLLERASGLALDVELMPRNPLPLAPYMLGLPEDLERERRRFELYADLTASVPLLHVSCDLSDHPADVADLIEQALAGSVAEPALGASR
jgi:hypothetical protein